MGVAAVALLLDACFTAGGFSDNLGGTQPMHHVAATSPPPLRVSKAWADSSYRTKDIDHGAALGINIEVALASLISKNSVCRRFPKTATQRHHRLRARAARLTAPARAADLL